MSYIGILISVLLDLGVVNNVLATESLHNFCESDDCQSYVSDVEIYPYAFKPNFNMNLTERIHDIDHFKLSCKRLIGKKH